MLSSNQFPSTNYLRHIVTHHWLHLQSTLITSLPSASNWRVFLNFFLLIKKTILLVENQYPVFHMPHFTFQFHEHRSQTDRDWIELVFYSDKFVLLFYCFCICSLFGPSPWSSICYCYVNDVVILCDPSLTIFRLIYYILLVVYFYETANVIYYTNETPATMENDSVYEYNGFFLCFLKNNDSH